MDKDVFRLMVLAILLAILASTSDGLVEILARLSAGAIGCMVVLGVVLDAVELLRGGTGRRGYEVDDWLDPGSTRRGR